MKLQIKPNRWTCVPTSFAMVLDAPVEQILIEIGHDGSDIWWPKLEEPLNRRGFHVQECFKSCFIRKVRPVHFDFVCASTPTDNLEDIKFFDVNISFVDLFAHLDAVILGYHKSNNYHAVAWCHNTKLIYDPQGLNYDLSEFQPRELIFMFRDIVPSDT